MILGSERLVRKKENGVERSQRRHSWHDMSFAIVLHEFETTKFDIFNSSLQSILHIVTFRCLTHHRRTWQPNSFVSHFCGLTCRSLGVFCSNWFLKKRFCDAVVPTGTTVSLHSSSILKVHLSNEYFSFMFKQGTPQKTIVMGFSAKPAELIDIEAVNR